MTSLVRHLHGFIRDVRLTEDEWNTAVSFLTEVGHITDELEVRPVDVVMGHHFTSTYPGSHFTTGLMIGRHLPDRHVMVTHESVTMRTPGQPTEHSPLRDGELGEWLTTLEVPVTADERDRLINTVRTLNA